MNKFICIAVILFAAIASGSCNEYGSHYDGHYGHPSAASASSAAAAADGASYGGHHYNHYSAPAYNHKSYGHKYSYQPAYATELYPKDHHYKQYNTHSSYSQVALPVVQDAPLAKLYTPKSYGGYGHSSY
ncbi:chorion protein 19 [Haematobia irritans]|uniref:Putative conserved secreted protein n=1 Tax=Haematobia irritans TaxID=7368 RepID=A0A1L8EBD9_HAEIR